MKKLLTIILLVMFPASVFAAPTFGSAGTLVQSLGTTNTTSITLTAGNLVGVYCYHNGTTDSSGATWNGTETMVRLFRVGGSQRQSVFILQGGTSGTHSSVVTFSGSNTSDCVTFQYSGTDTSTTSPVNFAGIRGTQATSASITRQLTGISALNTIVTTVNVACTTFTATQGTSRNNQASFERLVLMDTPSTVGSTTTAGTCDSADVYTAIGFELLAPAATASPKPRLTLLGRLTLLAKMFIQ